MIGAILTAMQPSWAGTPCFRKKTRVISALDQIQIKRTLVDLALRCFCDKSSAILSGVGGLFAIAVTCCASKATLFSSHHFYIDDLSAYMFNPSNPGPILDIHSWPPGTALFSNLVNACVPRPENQQGQPEPHESDLSKLKYASERGYLGHV